MGIINVIGRSATAAAPMISELDERLPLVLLAVMCIFGAIGPYFLQK
jgi:hypothetical protein